MLYEVITPLGVTPEVALGSLGLGTDVQSPVTTETTAKLLSYFGRVNYTSYNFV